MEAFLGSPTVSIYVGDSAREKLLAKLSNPAATNAEAQRAAAIARGHAQVDAHATFGAMTARADRVVRDGEAHAALEAQQRADLRQEKFGPWQTAETERYAQTLLGETTAIEEDGARARATFATPTLPAPATVSAAIDRHTRIQVLGGADPNGALKLVDDAILRDDQPFLALAELELRSFPDYKNQWRTSEGRTMARLIIEKIAAATPPDAETAKYAADRVELYLTRWRYLVNQLLSGHGRLDPAHRAAGALAPLLEPL
jgi:hypothetical protein